MPFDAIRMLIIVMQIEWRVASAKSSCLAYAILLDTIGYIDFGSGICHEPRRDDQSLCVGHSYWSLNIESD